MPSSVLSVSDRVTGGATDARERSKRPVRGTLLSRISQPGFLRQSFAALRSKRSSFGVDGVTLSDFEKHLRTHIHILRQRLRAGTYEFSELRPIAIPKGNGKFRPILVPTVEDRVVQRAILKAIAPSVEPHVDFSHSFAFRRGRGVKDAVTALKKALDRDGRWVLIVDIEEFFPSVNADNLLVQLADLLPDESLRPLLARLFEWEIKGLTELPEVKRGCFPTSRGGLPQGSLLSPMLANLYLAPFDQFMKQSGMTFLRYADDLAVVCDSREEAVEALAAMTHRLSELGLRLPALGQKKCRVWDFDRQGVEYLGCYVQRSGRDIRVSPARDRIEGIKKTISDTCDAGRTEPLSVRYRKLAGLVQGWLSAYAQLCDITSRRTDLLEHTQAELTKLLVARGLIPRSSGLTAKQREFLSLDDIFNDSKTKDARLEGPRRKLRP